MNINNLQVQFQSAVENAATEASTDNTSATLYYLQLAKAIQTLNMGQIRTVANTASLPSASTNEGWLYFIDNLERLYFSNGTVWDGVVPIVYDNTLWSWGSGGYGRLGDNSVTNKSSPVSVVGGFTDWLQVATGAYHSTGVKQNGTAWAWGRGDYGRLGDNTVVSKRSPVSVVGGFTDWCQISAGWASSNAVRQNGTAWGWGNNGTGRLGDGTTTNRSSPVSVVGGFTDWCQISSGYSHTLAVRQNGSLWAWGAAGNGSLGNNNTNPNTSSPVSVVGGFTDWCQASAGGFGGASAGFSVAVRQNGTAWAWGFNVAGQLGDNTATNRSSPVSVVGGFTDWCQVSASDFYNDQFSNGVRQNGTLWSWGGNDQGQLGTNNTTSRSSPVSVVGGFTDWCQVTAGYKNAAAVRTNGTLWSWGNGNLGDGSNTSRSSPVSVVGGFTDWCQVSTGFSHSLAIRRTQV